MRSAATVLAILLLVALPGRGERIKDIVEIEGIRGNPIWGYGVVVGLNGTGDGSEVSKRALANILRKCDLKLEPKDISSKNIASVMVTSQLPPFARAGTTIDVTVSAIGSAASLQGGTLLMTPLWGADHQVYAVAQGPITLGGFAVSGQAASVTKNHPTVGRIPSGAIVEKAELASFVRQGRINLQLRYPDFSTARRIAQAVNKIYRDSSVAVDAGSVRVEVPKTLRRSELSRFIDRIGAQEVEVDQPAVVIINERTGTIVVGENVGVSTVAISHGSLSIVTKEQPKVSQALPLAPGGTTVTTPSTDILAREQGGPLHVVPEQVTVADLARALNAMGLTPRDLVAIFEALRQAGALHARLVIM
jgi:flagellar P-ring protein precursor FlgI